jgi:hypothetical protein
LTNSISKKYVIASLVTSLFRPMMFWYFIFNFYIDEHKYGLSNITLSSLCEFDNNLETLRHKNTLIV